jgi:hypothetical protein
MMFTNVYMLSTGVVAKSRRQVKMENAAVFQFQIYDENSLGDAIPISATHSPRTRIVQSSTHVTATGRVKIMSHITGTSSDRTMTMICEKHCSYKDFAIPILRPEAEAV